MSELDPAAGAAYFVPDPDAIHDQGDEPAEHPCPACVGGWHGAHCQGEFWTTAQPPAQVECDCIEGACRGEWKELGALTEVGGVPADSGRARIAPLGTPAPEQIAGLVPHLTIWDEPAAMDQIGPPIPVYREERPDGTYAQGSIGPAHPAYAAVRAGLTDSLSIGDGPVRKCADNGPYVVLDPVRRPVSGASQGVPVASPAVNPDAVRVSPGEVEQLAERLAELARPKPPPRPNRATRRQLDKAAGRLGKRRRG